MGFWPFAWSWKTKGGGRVFVGGFILTPALLGLNWWFNNNRAPDRHGQRQLPPPRQGDNGAFLGDGQRDGQGDDKGL